MLAAAGLRDCRADVGARGNGAGAPRRADGPTNGGQCTSNFGSSTPRTTSTSVRRRTAPGQTATRPPTAATAGSLPVGTPVTVDGASQPGSIVYSSWVTMQANGETDPGHLPVQRHRADQAQSGGLRQGQPEHPVLGQAVPDPPDGNNTRCITSRPSAQTKRAAVWRQTLFMIAGCSKRSRCEVREDR